MERNRGGIRMAVIIQEVVGREAGGMLFPAFAGVAFSRCEMRWSPRIRHTDGMARLVLGLGTRAVDRTVDDYPVLATSNPRDPDAVAVAAEHEHEVSAGLRRHLVADRRVEEALGHADRRLPGRFVLNVPHRLEMFLVTLAHQAHPADAGQVPALVIHPHRGWCRLSSFDENQSCLQVTVIILD